MHVSIRGASESDIPSILTVEQSSPSAAHWAADQYKSRIADGFFLVAESDGRIRGFLCARTVAGEWEIENIVVEEQSRRHQIASRLMRELLTEWRQQEGAAVLLEVRESNAPARGLYEKSGLREVGRRRGYYRDPVEDAVLYSLDSET